MSYPNTTQREDRQDAERPHGSGHLVSRSRRGMPTACVSPPIPVPTMLPPGTSSDRQKGQLAPAAGGWRVHRRCSAGISGGARPSRAVARSDREGPIVGRLHATVPDSTGIGAVPRDRFGSTGVGAVPGAVSVRRVLARFGETVSGSRGTGIVGGADWSVCPNGSANRLPLPPRCRVGGGRGWFRGTGGQVAVAGRSGRSGWQVEVYLDGAVVADRELAVYPAGGSRADRQAGGQHVVELETG
jgi:hypothetical protein